MKIILTGSAEMIQRFRAYPAQFSNAMRKFMERALLLIWESVPPYPVQLPTSSGYVRTNTLGRSIGAGGGEKPDIYEVKQQGADYFTARFGTNLEYAPYVIGDADTQQTGEMKRRNWWTLPQTVLEKAQPKLEHAWEITIDAMARWLEGKQNG